MKGIGINGYGTIGKRVADAVTAQDDMKIVGVTKRTPDYEAKAAVERGYDLYISVPEREEQFEGARAIRHAWLRTKESGCQHIFWHAGESGLPEQCWLFWRGLDGYGANPVRYTSGTQWEISKLWVGNLDVCTLSI